MIGGRHVAVAFPFFHNSVVSGDNGRMVCLYERLAYTSGVAAGGRECVFRSAIVLIPLYFSHFGHPIHIPWNLTS